MKDGKIKMGTNKFYVSRLENVSYNIINYYSIIMTQYVVKIHCGCN